MRRHFTLPSTEVLGTLGVTVLTFDGLGIIFNGFIATLQPILLYDSISIESNFPNIFVVIFYVLYFRFYTFRVLYFRHLVTHIRICLP